MFTVAYLANWSPHSTLGMVNPYKKLFKKETNLKHLRVIGAKAFVRIETHTKKLEPKAWTGISLRLQWNSKGYRVFNPITKRVLESRNVTFIETLPHVMPVADDDYQHLGFESFKDLYEVEEDFLRDLRDHTEQIDINSISITADHLNHVRHLNEDMQSLLNKIHTISERDQHLDGWPVTGLREERPGEVTGAGELGSVEPGDIWRPRVLQRGATTKVIIQGCEHTVYCEGQHRHGARAQGYGDVPRAGNAGHGPPERAGDIRGGCISCKKHAAPNPFGGGENCRDSKHLFGGDATPGRGKVECGFRQGDGSSRQKQGLHAGTYHVHSTRHEICGVEMGL